MAPAKASGQKTSAARHKKGAATPKEVRGKKPVKKAMKAKAKADAKPPKDPQEDDGNRRDRNKDRFLKLHKHELPQTIQKLLDSTSSHAQGKLINKLVVKDESGQ